MKIFEAKLNAEGKRFALIVSRYNDFISKRLLEGALQELIRHGASEDSLEVYWVPGSYEMPCFAKRLAGTGKYHALLCLGAIIKGETPHFDYVAAEAAKGIAQVSMHTGVPVAFGVITADSLEQAIDRAGAKSGNKGEDAARVAIEMANLMALTEKKK